MTKTTTVLEFNGNKYNLQQLLTIAKSSPSIPIEELHINDPQDPINGDRFAVQFHGPQPPESTEVLVFKQEGKHTILFGRDLYQGGVKRARLISTPALKKTRYEKAEEATPERVAASTATGAMADKMQQAFKGRPEAKQRAFVDRNDVKFDPYHGLKRDAGGGFKRSETIVAAVHVPPRQEEKPAGYSEMTSHQKPQRGGTGVNRTYSSGRPVNRNDQK